MVVPWISSVTGLTSVGGGGGKVTPLPPAMVVGLAGADLSPGLVETSEAKAIVQAQTSKKARCVIFIVNAKGYSSRWSGRLRRQSVPALPFQDKRQLNQLWNIACHRSERSGSSQLRMMGEAATLYSP